MQLRSVACEVAGANVLVNRICLGKPRGIRGADGAPGVGGVLPRGLDHQCLGRHGDLMSGPRVRAPRSVVRCRAANRSPVLTGQYPDESGPCTGRFPQRNKLDGSLSHRYI